MKSTELATLLLTLLISLAGIAYYLVRHQE
jgi:hypothetical protein